MMRMMVKDKSSGALSRPLARLTALALIAALALSAPASAQRSLKAMRAAESEERDLAGEAAYTNSVCGSDMDARIDWGSVSDWPEGESLVDACDGALGALEAACRSGAGKERIQSLSSFVCAGDGDGPSLSGRTFRYGASPGQSGFEETADYLDAAF